MQKSITFFVALLLTLFIIRTEAYAQTTPSETFAEGVIVSIESKTVIKEEAVSKYKTFVVRGVTAPIQDKEVRITGDESGELSGRSFREGDRVILSISSLPNGKEQIYIVDYVRRTPLAALTALFLFAVFAIGRKKGAYSIAGMAYSFAVIMLFMVPRILAGDNPMMVSLTGAFLIIPVTFLLTHGLNKKTFVALVSTAVSLTLTVLLAFVFVQATRLTGSADEGAVFVRLMQGNSINLANLLLAGIIIGAMGILDDVTISQTSIVSELRNANAKLTATQLFKQAMAVGRDHIASLVNTLILVYAGAALPLFLLFQQSRMSYAQVINQEIVAVEVVRMLTASIGIIAAVPITTFLAVKFLSPFAENHVTS